MAHTWVDPLPDARRARSGRPVDWPGIPLFILLALVVLAGCASAPARVTAAATATPTTTLPHFSDWRAAYLASDGRVHIVTLDGKSDLVGQTLPDLTNNWPAISTAGVSPNGKFIVYSTDTTDLVDLTGTIPPKNLVFHGTPHEMRWSPDGSKVLWVNDGAQYAYLTVSTGHLTTFTVNKSYFGNDGWIGNSHFAAESTRGMPTAFDSTDNIQFPSAVELCSVDITTGHVRVIAMVQGVGPSDFQFSISPDGSEALYNDNPWRGNSFTPLVGTINLVTGALTPLPTIARLTQSDFTSIAWRPGTEQVAVSTESAANNNLGDWLLDLQHDTATQLGSGNTVLTWTPDGTHLLLTNAPNPQSPELNTGPNILSAMTVGTAGETHTTVLTDDAMDFPMLGLVRNP